MTILVNLQNVDGASARTLESNGRPFGIAAHAVAKAFHDAKAKEAETTLARQMEEEGPFVAHVRGIA